LEDKNYRDEHQQFVVEGIKMMNELVHSNIVVETLYALPEWIAEHTQMISGLEIVPVEWHEMKKISSLKTSSPVLAIAKIPCHTSERSTLAILLDDIQDPGNVGSILRIADWYNVAHVFCSEACADVYNPKVIQASMGSAFRIRVEKCDLTTLVAKNTNLPLYVCVLDGEDVNSLEKITKGFIVIGNESRGVSNSLIELSSHKIAIKRKGGAESLNAAVAAGIICHCMLS